MVLPSTTTEEVCSPLATPIQGAGAVMVKSYIDAHERNDLDGLMSLLRDDLRFVMLPEAGTSVSTAKDAVDGWVSGGLFQRGYDDWRGIATTVNRMPAAALYLRTSDAAGYRPFAIAVLHVVDGKIGGDKVTLELAPPRGSRSGRCPGRTATPAGPHPRGRSRRSAAATCPSPVQGDADGRAVRRDRQAVTPTR